MKTFLTHLYQKKEGETKILRAQLGGIPLLWKYLDCPCDCGPRRKSHRYYKKTSVFVTYIEIASCYEVLCRYVVNDKWICAEIRFTEKTMDFNKMPETNIYEKIVEWENKCFSEVLFAIKTRKQALETVLLANSLCSDIQYLIWKYASGFI